MKTAANGTRASSSPTSCKSFSLSATRSTLLSTAMRGELASLSLARIGSRSSSRPLAASITRTTRSASLAPPQAASTIAWSKRRRGTNSPGVSMNTSWLAPSVAMPRSGTRVVCTLWETIDTLAPTSALTSVDLPALGAPITAINPQRCASVPALPWSLPLSPASLMGYGPPHAVTLEQGARRLLLCSPFGISLTARRRAAGDAHLRGEVGRVVGPLARDLDVLRQRQALTLRPLLQRRLGIG